MHCLLLHHLYCCALPSPVCLLHLFICTCINSSPIACPQSSVLCWCLIVFFLFFFNFILCMCTWHDSLFWFNIISNLMLMGCLCCLWVIICFEFSVYCIHNVCIFSGILETFKTFHIWLMMMDNTNWRIGWAGGPCFQMKNVNIWRAAHKTEGRAGGLHKRVVWQAFPQPAGLPLCAAHWPALLCGLAFCVARGKFMLFIWKHCPPACRPSV